jgi:predicted sulfurtransferase
MTMFGAHSRYGIMTWAAGNRRMWRRLADPQQRSLPLMKTRLLGLAVLAVALGSPVFAQIADEASVPRISLADFKKAVDAGQVLIIDVRDAGSYADGHIPGAILVPLADIAKKAPGLKASKKPIVAYCA